jgi:uncharacterized membrane protein
MQWDNPLQINDWGIMKFLNLVLAIQLIMWGVIGLDTIGLNIPIIRQLICFVYLTFVPGILILRVLKLHKLGNIETLLYTVGLSIATLMFTGLSMNMVYPLFGISRPISLTPLIITISAFVLILCVLSYKIDRDFSDPSFIDIKNLLSPPALFLCLIPFSSVFGVYFVSFYHTNILISLLIIVIISIIILATFDRVIPKRLYPLAIFIISISLLFHNSLLSPYLFGTDILHEHYLYKLVEVNSRWAPSLYYPCNAMLSITILPQIYSTLLKMDGTWIFKIAYIFIFSLVPVGLYQIYRGWTSEKTAFLSSFFFVAFYGFFSTMLYLARQQIAEFFFVLLLSLILKKDINALQRTVLLIFFSASLIASHYALSYIFIFYVSLGWCLLRLMKAKEINITATWIMLFSVMLLSWYMYTASSAPFNTLVNMGSHIYDTFYIDMFNPGARGSDIQAIVGIKSSVSFGHDIGRFFLQITQFFIVVGCVTTISNRKHMKLNPQYITLSLISLLLLLMCVIIPNFIGHFNMDRMYHTTLLILSPFCILGIEAVFSGVSRLFKSISLNKSVYKKALVLIVLIPYFLYNVGFIYEVTGDYPTSCPLSMYRMENSEDLRQKSGFYDRNIPEQDIPTARWLSKNRDINKWIRADTPRAYELTGYGGIPLERTFRLTTQYTSLPHYLYLGYANTKGGILRGFEEGIRVSNSTEIEPLLQKGDKLYSNGGSEIYLYS